MNRKIKLRVLGDLPSQAPTADVLRASLGGRCATHPDTGSLVVLAGRDEPALVLHADDDEVHLWIGEGLVRRAKRAQITPFDGAPPPATARVTREIREFARLQEGERVLFFGNTRDDKARVEGGKLAEKCRFGALVLRDDGVLLGVGFRRLWRAAGQHGEQES